MENTQARKLNFRLKLSVDRHLLICVCGCLASLLIYSFIDARNCRKTSIVTSGLKENYLTLCIGKLHGRMEYHWKRKTETFHNSIWLRSDRKTRQLLQYTTKNVIACLDILNHRYSFAPNVYHIVEQVSSRNTNLYFEFLGDSRIRQQFLNFIRVIPDYDIKSYPNPIPYRYHGDIEVTSSILRLKVSFKWQPLIDHKLSETLHQWVYNKTERPHFIFLGIAAWHMLQEHGADYHLYQKKLTELGPILSQLADISHVIWINQYPIVDFYGNISSSNTYIHSEKIYYYNEAIRHILKNLHSKIIVWESSDFLVEDYIRSCAFLHRKEKQLIGGQMSIDYAFAYFNCGDYIHPGYSALSEATHILFNDLCNAVLYNKTI